MKYLLAAMILMVSLTASAGNVGRYHGGQIDEYDRATGFYFKSITTEEEGGLMGKGAKPFINDINIYNPITGENIVLFNDENIHHITGILYESHYDAENQKIDFGDSVSSIEIKNNDDIVERLLKDKLLILVTNKKAETHTLWTASKAGKGLSELITFPFYYDWHMDVQNSVIRIVGQDGNKVKIENIAW